MFVAIVGSGAMGCLFGGFLAEKGHRVVLVDVWPQHIEAINSNGLMLETGQGKKIIRIPARFAHEVEGQPDLVIVFTKTFYTEEALETARGFIGENTAVLTLQNGLGNVETILKYVPGDRIIAGVTSFPSDLVGPGHVRSLGSGQTKIMSGDGRITPRLEDFKKTLDDAGFNCEISDEVFASIWEKVAFNAALNSLTAVTGLTLGQLGAVPEGVELAHRIAGEVVEVANKKGVQARKEAVHGLIESVFVEHFNHMPSMLQDVLAQRRTEIESINGDVTREAEKTDVPVPTTEVLYKLVRILEQSYGGRGQVKSQPN
ncbi:MAG: ketopantoate reductase family protein [Desulfocucumaceae bacterium]